MMFGLPLGMFVEIAVAILLALTIGYCVVLNERLKKLHADRGELRQMVTDLVQATNLANTAIKELKSTAAEADTVLTARLDEAERFGVELANHINAGQAIMERIARITTAAAKPPQMVEELPQEPSPLQSALQQLASRARMRGNAA
jgi:prefoldin subunit 5